MIKNTIKKYLLFAGLTIFAVLMMWVLLPIIIGQPINDKVYTIKEEKSEKNSFAKKISNLDIDTAMRDDLVKIFGEPEVYLWGDNTYTKEKLPDYYLMKYSDKFQVFMVAGKIVEFRFNNPAYSFMDSISIGSGIDDVKKALGKPISEKKAVPHDEMKEGILYTDEDGVAGSLSYMPKGKNIMLVFNNYKVTAMFLRRSDRDLFLSNYKSKDTLGNSPTRIVDKIDYPFVNDPEIVGKWKGVELVKEIGNFGLANRNSRENEYRLQIIFEESGKTDIPINTWTKGLVLNIADKTASKYEIKDMGGSKYMFLQWKSGDYGLRGDKPCYYVLKKIK